VGALFTIQSYHDKGLIWLYYYLFYRCYYYWIVSESNTMREYSDELAESVVTHEILPQLVFSLSQQNRFYKKAAAFVLRAVSKHSPQLAQAVVDSGALDALVT
jgi:hypothetical protein